MHNLFCIHREQDSFRKKSLIDNINKVGISPTFIEPIPAHDDFKESKIFNKEMNSLRETTIQIVTMAKENNWSSVAIMEDDCVINKNRFDKFLNSELPKNFDIIQLASSGEKSFSLSSKEGIFKRVLKSWSCQFYIINNNIYDLYLKLLKEHHKPIDLITVHIQGLRRNSFLVQPEPVLHIPNNYSTLNNKIVKY